MDDNAYQSPTIREPQRGTRGTHWAIWSGVVCLVLAGLCTVLTVAGLIASFQAVAQASRTPKAEDLATGVSDALIPAYGVIPLGLLGIILVAVGLVVRRPIED